MPLSLGAMVKRLAGLIDTRDISGWENRFLKSVLAATRSGDDARALTDRQIDVIERIFRNHFA
jgi:hypothetical protein